MLMMMTKETEEGILQVQREVHFEDMTSRNVLEKKEIHSLIGITPNVINKEIFECKNSGAITVTNLINGSPGQRIHILGDGNTTIEHGTSIFTNTGANKLLLADVVYTFTYFTIIGPPKTYKWVENE